MIIGKVVKNAEQPFIFVNPFDTYFNMTDNLIDNSQNAKNALFANGDNTSISIFCEINE
jgi:hypothetical protein